MELSNPITGIVGCCARTVKGHANAALPSVYMNCRCPISNGHMIPNGSFPKDITPRIGRALFQYRSDTCGPVLNGAKPGDTNYRIEILCCGAAPPPIVTK